MEDTIPDLEYLTYSTPKDQPKIAEHGLSYPGFSVVFIHTYTLPDYMELYVPESNKTGNVPESTKTGSTGDEDKKAIALSPENPLMYEDQRIEKMMFVSQSDDCRLVYLDDGNSLFKNKPLSHKVLLEADADQDREKMMIFSDDSVYRFSMCGFDFHMPIRSKKDTEGTYDFSPLDLEGKVHVEVSLFFGNTVSVTYKFYFNGKDASIKKPLEEGEDGDAVKCDATTDHIIALVSSFLSAEYWNDKDNDINLGKRFIAKNFWLDPFGDVLDEENRKDLNLEGPDRVFDEIMLRYKRHLYRHHTAYSLNATRDQISDEEKKVAKDNVEVQRLREKIKVIKDPTETETETETETRVLEQRRNTDMLSVENDHHYAMVDIWETVKHVETYVDENTELDLFSKDRPNKLTEAEIVRHIKDHHKPELIGLMTLYPCEWPYREDEAYADVCGDSIAIDSDDLVLVGSHMAVVIGTYGRRGSESSGVDWKSVLENRDKYHVAWPEFLLILQFVLAKKHIINQMKDKMIELALEFKRGDTEEDLSGKNSDFMLDVSRQLLQLDIVKYARFASHRVMYDRTMKRLNLEHDLQSVREISDMLNDNIQNISDNRAVKSDHLLNGVLLTMSIMAGCELLFQESRFDFADKLFCIDGPWNTLVAAALIAVIAVVIFFGVTLLIRKYIAPYLKMRERKKKNKLQ